MNVRCPGCGAAVALAVGDTRLACAACGMATPISRVGTEPGAATAGAALVALEVDLTNTTVAGRTLVERIGAGGMGTVYRARDARGDVAIKVLRPALGVDRAVVLARFAREAEALRRLDHPRVVRLLEHGEDGAIAYIVTELVTGRDLAARLGVHRPSLAEIADIFGQVCDGVAAAHAAGIVHRDLKPANILVGDDGQVKVADFGLAQLGADATVTTLTRTDVAMGTFHYLAPEQRRDARAVDHRADVWALGVILYELLTGELPLGSFAPPSTKGPAAGDRRADAIVRRALAPDPADRFASVAELGAAVRALVAPRRTARARSAIVAISLLAVGTAGAVAAHVARDDAPRAAPAVAIATLDAADAPARLDAALLADAAVDAPPDAPPAAIVDAGVDAARPPDAAVAVPRPSPPRKVVKRPTGKPAAKTVAKTVAVPAECRAARRCCVAVRGADCGALLTAEVATCATALIAFRDAATNPKQRAMCR